MTLRRSDAREPQSCRAPAVEFHLCHLIDRRGNQHRVLPCPSFGVSDPRTKRTSTDATLPSSSTS
ncbi:hypothetical protein ACFOLD_06115 [Kocuria carniphila]|uniref:hypothetical protein n=1 Tax=Kocuria carniphila TaxID=262208 RepID=UPI0036070772